MRPKEEFVKLNWDEQVVKESELPDGYRYLKFGEKISKHDEFNISIIDGDPIWIKTSEIKTFIHNYPIVNYYYCNNDGICRDYRRKIAKKKKIG